MSKILKKMKLNITITFRIDFESLKKSEKYIEIK